MDIKAGVYIGKVDPNSVVTGKSTKGTPQVSVTVLTKEIGPIGIALYLSADSAAGSIARLRACGWKGNSFRDMAGIGDNEIAIKIEYDNYTDAEGTRQVMKSSILSGGGGLRPAEVISDAAAFDALVAATTGLPIGKAGPKGEPPPF